MWFFSNALFSNETGPTIQREEADLIKIDVLKSRDYLGVAAKEVCIEEGGINEGFSAVRAPVVRLRSAVHQTLLGKEEQAAAMTLLSRAC